MKNIVFLFYSDWYDLYFTVAKQGFLGNFGAWIFNQKDIYQK